MANGKQTRGQTVAATFEGPLRSDAALSALKDAGFQPGQVAVQVIPGKESTTSGADNGAGVRTVALAAGVILGAIVGAFLGRTFGDGTLALILGAVIGAVVGGPWRGPGAARPYRPGRPPTVPAT